MGTVYATLHTLKLKLNLRDINVRGKYPGISVGESLSY